MNNRIKTEVYESNIHLNLLYDLLSSLQNNGSRFFYPEEINKEISVLLNKIDKYIHHDKKGYDLIKETWYSELTFKKND